MNHISLLELISGCFVVREYGEYLMRVKDNFLSLFEMMNVAHIRVEERHGNTRAHIIFL